MSISEIPHTALEDRLIEIVNELSSIGDELASARSEYEQLDDYKKIILAVSTPDGGTAKDRELLALKSERYKEHVDALCVAREKYYKLYAKHTALNNKFEAVRSILSTRREEMRRL